MLDDRTLAVGTGDRVKGSTGAFEGSGTSRAVGAASPTFSNPTAFAPLPSAPKLD